jgi:hypothetical protein
VHVMGYFTSVLRERIANFEAPRPPPRRLPPGASRLRSWPRRRWGFRSMICARTSPTSMTRWTRSASHPGCVADFPPPRRAKAPLRRDGGQVGGLPGGSDVRRVWKPATQQTWKSALRRACEVSGPAGAQGGGRPAVLILKGAAQGGPPERRLQAAAAARFVGAAGWFGRPAGLETRDTADLEVCATESV